MISAQLKLILEEFPVQANFEKLQQILNNLDPNTNNLTDIEWNFRAGLSINFSIVNKLNETHEFWCKSLNINIVWLAKILFLTSSQNARGTVTLRCKFDSIVKTLHFLAERNQLLIKVHDLEDYLSYVLMTSIHNNRIMKRLTPLNFQSFSNGIDSKEWVKILKTLELPLIGFNASFSHSIFTNALKNTIETVSAGGLTFRDWKDGGSF